MQCHQSERGRSIRCKYRVAFIFRLVVSIIDICDPFRWQTRDKSYEIQQFNDFMQMNAIDPIKCERNDDSTTPSTHSIHIEYVIVLNY